MRTSTEIKAILNYLYVSATRGSLEEDTAWYYRGIGKAGYEARTNRTTLESVYFITEVLCISEHGIYQMYLNDARYKQTYLSGAEVVRYILQNCSFEMSEEWDGFTNKKTGEKVTVQFVTLDGRSFRRKAQ